MLGASSYPISIETSENKLETNEVIDVDFKSENKVDNDETQARVNVTVKEGNNYLFMPC
jgi:outer membrane protein assembly factor BamA